jgi:hypothetical protein
MLLEILTALIVAVLLFYLFIIYLQWSQCYRSASDIDLSGALKNKWQYSMLPPRCVSDSLKYVSFWNQYYSSRYNLGTDQFSSLSYKCS